MLRRGAAILFLMSLVIFVASLIGAMGVMNDMSSAMGSAGGHPRSGAMMVAAVAGAVGNSVWAFGLACIVDRIDRHWGEKS